MEGHVMDGLGKDMRLNAALLVVVGRLERECTRAYMEARNLEATDPRTAEMQLKVCRGEARFLHDVRAWAERNRVTEKTPPPENCSQGRWDLLLGLADMYRHERFGDEPETFRDADGKIDMDAYGDYYDLQYVRHFGGIFDGEEDLYLKGLDREAVGRSEAVEDRPPFRARTEGDAPQEAPDLSYWYTERDGDGSPLRAAQEGGRRGRAVEMDAEVDGDVPDPRYDASRDNPFRTTEDFSPSELKAAADPLDPHKAEVYGRRGNRLTRTEMRRILQDTALTTREKTKDGKTVVHVVIPENFTEVAADALRPSDGVSEITFTGKVGRIPDHFAEECRSLRHAHFAQGVEEGIDPLAFLHAGVEGPEMTDMPGDSPIVRSAKERLRSQRSAVVVDQGRGLPVGNDRHYTSARLHDIEREARRQWRDEVGGGDRELVLSASHVTADDVHAAVQRWRSAHPGEEAEFDTIRFRTDKGTVQTVDPDCLSKVRDSVRGVRLVELDNDASSSDKEKGLCRLMGSLPGLKGVMVQGTATKVPERLLEDVEGVEAVYIGSGVREAGERCFLNTARRGRLEVTMEGHLESVGDWAFACVSGRMKDKPKEAQDIDDRCIYRHTAMERQNLAMRSVHAQRDGGNGYSMEYTRSFGDGAMANSGWAGDIVLGPDNTRYGTDAFANCRSRHVDFSESQADAAHSGAFAFKGVRDARTFYVNGIRSMPEGCMWAVGSNVTGGARTNLDLDWQHLGKDTLRFSSLTGTTVRTMEGAAQAHDLLGENNAFERKIWRAVAKGAGIGAKGTRQALRAMGKVGQMLTTMRSISAPEAILDTVVAGVAVYAAGAILTFKLLALLFKGLAALAAKDMYGLDGNAEKGRGAGVPVKDGLVPAARNDADHETVSQGWYPFTSKDGRWKIATNQNGCVIGMLDTKTGMKTVGDICGLQAEARERVPVLMAAEPVAALETVAQMAARKTYDLAQITRNIHELWEENKEIESVIESPGPWEKRYTAKNPDFPDKEGNPTVPLDENGNPVVLRDKDGNPTSFKDKVEADQYRDRHDTGRKPKGATYLSILDQLTRNETWGRKSKDAREMQAEAAARNQELRAAFRNVKGMEWDDYARKLPFNAKEAARKHDQERREERKKKREAAKDRGRD